MVKEIYCKLPTDINYIYQIETDSETEKILQQVKIVLGTEPSQILGMVNFGVDLKKYLFSYGNTAKEIEYTLNSAISAYVKYDTLKYSIDTEVNFGQDYNKCYDYAVVDIKINQKKCLGILISQ